MADGEVNQPEIINTVAPGLNTPAQANEPMLHPLAQPALNPLFSQASSFMQYAKREWAKALSAMEEAMSPSSELDETACVALLRRGVVDGIWATIYKFEAQKQIDKLLAQLSVPFFLDGFQHSLVILADQQ